MFRRLVRLGSFPACWRQANVTPIPKGPPSSSVANYRPICITSVLSKVIERLVSVRLGRFVESSGVFNNLISYADDSNLMTVVPSPGIRVTVSESLIRALGRVSELCDLWALKLNASKIKTMIVYRPRSMHPQLPSLTIGGTVLKESDDLDVLEVTFDSNMSFNKQRFT